MMNDYESDFEIYQELAISPRVLLDDIILSLTDGYYVDDSMVAFVIQYCLQVEDYESLAHLKKLYEKEHGKRTFRKFIK